MHTADDGAIVVFSLPRIGDTIRCHPAIRLLRSRFPDRPIDLVTHSRAVELAALMPEVRDGIGHTFANARLDLAERLRMASELRRRRYRTAFVFQASWKAALVPFLSMVPERIGYFGEFRWPLINRPRRGPRSGVLVDDTCQVVLDPGDNRPAEWPEPRLVVPDQQIAQWRSNSAEADDPRPVLAIAPGASYAARRWPVEFYAEVARRWTARGGSVWVVGHDSEKSLATRICSIAGQRARDLTDVSLGRAGCCLAAADLFLGNDSGPLHLAAALGTRSIGVYANVAMLQYQPNRNVTTLVPDKHVRFALNASEWPSVEAIMSAIDTQGQSDRGQAH